MRLLLDTHVFLWLISGSPKLSGEVREAITNLENEVYLSVVSVWEATVKYQLGKLPLPDEPGIYLPRQRKQHQIQSLGLDEAGVAKLRALPALHRDPFDRMLICQALAHDLCLVTLDEAIRQYPDVSVL